MNIKVLIERQVRAGFEGMVWDMLQELRSEAVRSRGYLFGETWRSVDNPRVFMVLTAWASPEQWETWKNDDYRRKMDERISRMLRRPSTIRVFEDAAEPPPLLSTRRSRKSPQARPPTRA